MEAKSAMSESSASVLAFSDYVCVPVCLPETGYSTTLCGEQARLKTGEADPIVHILDVSNESQRVTLPRP